MSGEERWNGLGLAITETSAMLDGSYPGDLCDEARLRRRVDKLAEEVGEVMEALGGLVGENPRKGVTHTAIDLGGELLDVAACALGAYEHLYSNDGSALDALYLLATYKRDRLAAAIKATA